MVGARPGAAGAGHDLRGRPPRRAAERDRPWCRSRSRRSSSAAGRRRAAGRRGDQLRAPEVGAAARRRRRAADRARRRAAATCRCWCPTSAASTGRSSSGVRHIAIFGSRDRDVRPAQPQPQPRRAVRDVRADRRAGRATPGWTSARYVSMCFGDPWEGAVPVEQVVDVGRRLLDLGATSSASATPSASAPPATSRRWSRLRRRRRRRPTGSRCTSTTPTARRWPTPTPRCGAASPRSTPAPAGSAAAPTPERHRQPRHRGPGVDADRARHRDRRRPRRLVATSGWMAGQLGRPSPSAVVRPGLTPQGYGTIPA